MHKLEKEVERASPLISNKSNSYNYKGYNGVNATGRIRKIGRKRHIYFGEFICVSIHTLRTSSVHIHKPLCVWIWRYTLLCANCGGN